MDGEGWSGVVMDCGNDSTYKIVIYVMILEYFHISYQSLACLMTCLSAYVDATLMQVLVWGKPISVV